MTTSIQVRDLEIALDQCCRGTAIPVANLSVPPSLASKSAPVAVLKGHIDKYNASQVDLLFKELSLSLGETQQQQDAFTAEISAVAKIWPAEIKRQVALVKSSFPGTAEKEVAFWKDLDKKMGETKAQLENAPVLLTKLVLKRVNRVSEQLVKEAEVRNSIVSPPKPPLLHRSYPLLYVDGARQGDRARSSVRNVSA